jgi:TOD1/MUCI70, glycosyltransferase-like domain
MDGDDPRVTVVAITSLYGDLDVLNSPPPLDDVDDYIAVTDRDHGPKLWRQVIDPRRHISNRLASKIPKCLPHLYTNADIVVWFDASATVRGDAATWAASHLGASPVAQFVHPERDDIADEAKVSAGMRKYQGLMVEEQAAHYKSLGMPDSWGLWATGLMARRQGFWSEWFGEQWLREQTLWSYQDQVSEPYVLWRCGIRPAAFDGSLWHDPHVIFGGHRSDD